ncbi:hypothetical protein M0812_21494 [Anaeramoeba flamelloides]|uniref:Uncharacterized protein n=1 Tax=Anaeramoeba flamelloides TaxID=1746091 RepID=A0AAV7YS21_9EUKA|nr:hypothetical protein M0812_21494 [Anaeramoeba flamelloides]
MNKKFTLPICSFTLFLILLLFGLPKASVNCQDTSCEEELTQIGAEFGCTYEGQEDGFAHDFAVFPATDDYLVVWNDGNSYPDTLKGRIYDGTTNEPLTPEFQACSSDLYTQKNAAVGIVNETHFIVTFQGKGTTWNLYGQVFQYSGGEVHLIGNEFQINTYTDYSQEAPEMVILSTDYFFVVWQSDNGDGWGYGVSGQLLSIKNINAIGEKIGNETIISTYTRESQLRPSVAKISSGGDKIIVVWESNWQDGSYTGIFGQAFQTLGNYQGVEKVGSEFQINTQATKYQNNPTVSSFSDHKYFVVFWENYEVRNNNYDICGQIYYSETLETIGDEFIINVHTQSDQLYPSTSQLSENSFIVTWSSRYQDGSSYGVYGKVYSLEDQDDSDEKNLRAIDPFQINTHIENNQYYSQVKSFFQNEKKFVVLWQSDQQHTDGMNGIFGQQFEMEEFCDDTDSTKDDDDDESSSITIILSIALPITAIFLILIFYIQKKKMTQRNANKVVGSRFSDDQDGIGNGNNQFDNANTVNHTTFEKNNFNGNENLKDNDIPMKEVNSQMDLDTQNQMGFNNPNQMDFNNQNQMDFYNPNQMDFNNQNQADFNLWN